MRVNGNLVADMPQRDDGLTAVPVPRGKVDLAADWITTPDVIAGRLISVAAAALVTVLWWIDRRRNQARLS